MKPADARARKILANLEALARYGIDGERAVAKVKLERHKAAYDFSAPDPTATPDLFAGTFRASTVAQPVIALAPGEVEIANAVKWAIEAETRIQCVFRGGALFAEATPDTANRLARIAGTVADSFRKLWEQCRTAGAHPADRNVFFLGLWDGMMREERHGQLLPSRAAARVKPPRAKKNALTPAPRLNLHPYSIALGLGKKIRFCVPLETIAGELDRTIKGELQEK